MAVHPFPSKKPDRNAGAGDWMSIALTLLTGALAGFLAGVLVGHPRWGLLGSTLAGLIGGSVGSWLLGLFNLKLDLGQRWLNTVATSTIGAVVVIVLARLLS
jgi:uncharacterized membrane protein YeaQ/YmgE (transglycosylase-associated protein family)